MKKYVLMFLLHGDPDDRCVISATVIPYFINHNVNLMIRTHHHSFTLDRREEALQMKQNQTFSFRLDVFKDGSDGAQDSSYIQTVTPCEPEQCFTVGCVEEHRTLT